MQISSQVDNLILTLGEQKSLLSEHSKPNTENFSNLLEETVADIASSARIPNEPIALTNQQNPADIPEWVNENYAYDPQNPRKPNMRELMEAMAGKSVEELYAAPNESWKDISRQASDILYDVIGVNEDTRDWTAIMTSGNVLATARAETGKMYEPKVDIISNFDSSVGDTDQIAVLKDKNENILRKIPNSLPLAEKILRNFGSTQASIPDNLEEKVIDGKINDTLLDFLKNFDKPTDALNQVALKTANNAVARTLAGDLSLEDLEKL